MGGSYVPSAAGNLDRASLSVQYTPAAMERRNLLQTRRLADLGSPLVSGYRRIILSRGKTVGRRDSRGGFVRGPLDQLGLCKDFRNFPRRVSNRRSVMVEATSLVETARSARPLVSFAISVYNAAEILSRTLLSVSPKFTAHLT